MKCRVNIAFDDETARRLKQAAECEGMTVSAFVSKAIARNINEDAVHEKDQTHRL
jgi:uncharacterized protein (DUF1778 family)